MRVWPIELPARAADRVACPYCDGNSHRCDQCDGDGWLYADEAPERSTNPSAEIYDARH